MQHLFPNWCFLLLALLLATAGTAQAQRPASFVTTTVSVGNSPFDVKVADLNLDGRPDIVTADYLGTLTVLLGTGAGSFGSPSVLGAGASGGPAFVAVADVNGDGKPDLLRSNLEDNTASVLLGTGTGSFGAPAVFTTSTNPRDSPVDVTAADVNQDGKLDLIVTNGYTSNIGVLLGTGTGSFGAVTMFRTDPASSYPETTKVADVNHDGKPDLVVVNYSTSSVGVLLGTGTGSFGTVTNFGVGGGSPYGMAVADVNGDGQLDALTANGSGGTLGVLLGTGTGSFGAAANFSVGSNLQDVKAADVNLDGKPDALVATYNTVAVLLGTGAGSFGAPTAFLTGGYNASALEVADVDGDGRPDLVTSNRASNTIGVLLNTTPVPATRTFLPVSTYATGTGSQPAGITAADVNLDGKPDALTANQGSNNAAVLLGTGTGSFGTAALLNLRSGSTPSGVAVADLDLDGQPDLLTANPGRDQVAVLLGTGTGAFGGNNTFDMGSGSQPAGIVVADVNQDGKPDALTANQGTNTVGLLLGKGTGSFGSNVSFGTGPGSQPAGIVVADVNLDGKPDALTADQGNNTIGVLLGTGTGTANTGAGSFGAVATFGTGSQPAGIAVADVDGDGKPDALTANQGSSTISVLLGKGTGSFGPAASFSTGTGSQPAGIVVADVNGDGKLDVLTANYGNNTVGVLLGTGTGSFGAVTTYGTGTGSQPAALALADVNRDGRPDVLVANSGGNTLGVLLGGLDLEVTTTTTIDADLYNTITVSSPGVATLAENVAVVSGVTVGNGGTLNDGCFVLSGPGSFTLQAGGSLGICSSNGISSTGNTGSIQVTGTRSFSTDALYTYNRSSGSQTNGNGLPATVRTLTLDNSAGFDLQANLTVSTALVLTRGVLKPAPSVALVLGSSATLSEDADGYITGTVQTTRTLATAGLTESFGGLGLTLTPSGSTLPGATLVRRVTGVELSGIRNSNSIKRYFDIQPAVRTGLNVALTLTARDDERNGITAANLRLFKGESTSGPWQPLATTSISATAASGDQPATYTARLGGISSFSIWTMGDASRPLPVELLDFTAERRGPDALLRWMTAQERDNNRFEVEASIDGHLFQRVGTVAGHGTSTAPHAYQFVDANFNRRGARQVYYRLRQVDQDGPQTLSDIRAVSGGGDLPQMAAYPNPAHAQVLVTGAAGNAPVDVYDATGRRLIQALADQSGAARLSLSVLPAGVYLVRSGAFTLRLVVN